MVTKMMKENSECLHKSSPRQRPPPFGERGSVSPGQGIRETEPGMIPSAGIVKQPTHQADSYFLGELNSLQK